MSFRIVNDLVKPRITLASTLTAAVGYTMARGKIDCNILPVLIGGFLLASAAAALNQIQEAEIDASVNRTSNRPIPSGRITKSNALIVTILLFSVGLFTLLYFYDLSVMLLGLTAALLYNGIYTPLKKITPFAAIPGALIGAIPPLVGWIAAEGHLIDPRIYYLCFFFFIWQIPHFWLLLLFYSDQYKNNKLPNLFDRFSEKRVRQLTFSGITATTITGFLLPYYILLEPKIVGYILSLLSIILFVRAASLLKNNMSSETNVKVNRSYRTRFMEINIYALIVTILTIFSNLL